MPYLYAIELLDGIKIGYESKEGERERAHKTSGARLHVFKRVFISDKSIDVTMKKYMKKLDLIADVPGNDQTTEVYKLTKDQAAQILDDIVRFDRIEEQFITNALHGKNDVKYEIITYAEICNTYGSKYKPPEFQRPVDIDRVSEIKEFILQNYNKRNFYMPAILLVRSEEVNERYYVIDGQHRCAAIQSIQSDAECMSQKIHVVTYPALTVEEQLQLFRDINKSKPVPEIYLNPVYLTKICNDVCSKLERVYGAIVNRNKPTGRLSHEIYAANIAALITNENLNNLIASDVLTDISSNSVFEFLRELNNAIIEKLIDAAENPKLLKIGQSDVIIDKSTLQVCNKINSGGNYGIKALADVINIIRTKPKKFVLGLIAKVPLILAYRIISQWDE